MIINLKYFDKIYFQYHVTTESATLNIPNIGIQGSSNDILQYVTSAVSSGQTQYVTTNTTSANIAAVAPKAEKKQEPPKEQNPCDICGKTFTTQGGLARHKSTHNKGEYKYSCEICTKSFSSEYNLEVHKSINHKRLKYKCEDCGESFPQKTKLTLHLKTNACKMQGGGGWASEASTAVAQAVAQAQAQVEAQARAQAQAQLEAQARAQAQAQAEAQARAQAQAQAEAQAQADAQAQAEALAAAEALAVAQAQAQADAVSSRSFFDEFSRNRQSVVIFPTGRKVPRQNYK